MPTPNGVNSYFSSCNILDYFADFQEQESKSGYSSYMSLFIFPYPIGICGFKGYTSYYFFYTRHNKQACSALVNRKCSTIIQYTVQSAYAT